MGVTSRMLRNVHARLLFPFSQMGEIQHKLLGILLSHDKVLVEAPTGSGKTAIVLSSLLAKKRVNQKIIIFVRTIAQFQPFLNEAKRIVEHSLRLQDEGIDLETVVALPVLGKGRLCLLRRNNQSLVNLPVGNICSLTSCPLRKKTKAAVFQNLAVGSKEKTSMKISVDVCDQPSNEMGTKVVGHPFDIKNEGAYESRKLEGGLDVQPSSYYEFIEESNYCSYYAQFSLTKYADVIITTYPFFFQKELRQRLLDETGIEWEKSIIVVDEAHNLYEKPRRLLNYKQISLLRKLEELSEFSEFFRFYDKKKKVKEGDTVQLPEVLVPEIELLSILDRFEINDSRNVNLSLVSEFLRFLSENRGKSVLFTEDAIMELPTLPRDYLKILHDCEQAYLVSGSLTPLDAYSTLYGLKSTQFKTFQLKDATIQEQKQQRKDFLILTDKKYSLRYNNRSEKTFKKIGGLIEQLHENVKKITLVFLPSYSLLKQVKKYCNPDVAETPKTTKEEVNQKLQNKKHLLVLGVAGGKFAEGIEFTENGHSLISSIIIAGLPYPPPGVEMSYKQKIYTEEYGKKLTHLFLQTLPMLAKLKQMLGRAKRAKHHRAAYIILDERIQHHVPYNNYPKFVSADRLISELKNKLI